MGSRQARETSQRAALVSRVARGSSRPRRGPSSCPRPEMLLGGVRSFHRIRMKAIPSQTLRDRRAPGTEWIRSVPRPLAAAPAQGLDFARSLCRMEPAPEIERAPAARSEGLPSAEIAMLLAVRPEASKFESIALGDVAARLSRKSARSTATSAVCSRAAPSRATARAGSDRFP